MRTLIISDLHLTDHPDEAYRWDVFSWSQKTLEQKNGNCLFILGDVFDKKDRHPATIVNRLAKELMEIAQHYPIYILQGNHDYLKIEHPFLSFLDHLPNIHWISTPQRMSIDNLDFLWLPHSRNPTEEWKDILKEGKQDLVLMHQSVIGCKVSNYYEMNHGLDLSWLQDQVKCQIISGDIHVPQTIQRLVYVGTQHPVSFGDDYDCRALWLVSTTNTNVKIKTWELESINIPGIKRHSLSVSSLDDLKSLYKNKVIKEHDHIKIKVVLTSEQFSKWPTLKETITNWCEHVHIKLFSIKLEVRSLAQPMSKSLPQKTFVSVHPTETYQRFLTQMSLDESVVKIGSEILNEVLNEKPIAN